MSFPRYPSYKDSGVEWLGKVPEHWETIPLSRTASGGSNSLFIDGDWIESKDLSDDGIRYLTSGNVGEGYYKEQGQGYISEETFAALNCIEVLPGDVLISRLNLPIGRSCLVPSLGGRIVTCVDNVIVRPDPDFNRQFFVYQLTSKSHFANMEILARGTTMQRISRSTLGRVRFAFPPLPEQTQIAAFLDRETAKIDGLVAEQRRLMELLNEEIISLVLSSFRAPETSELRLSEVSTIISRPVIQKAEESYTRIGLFNRGRGLFHKDASEMDDMGESDFFWIEEGDLIISGQFAWEGAVALADQEDTGCVVSHRYPVIRGKAGVALTEYLFGLLCTKHGDFLMNENSRGAAGRNRPLNISSLMKEKIPVPNMEIQKKVAQAVHTRKALFKEIAKAIDLLQERRTALISAAVTGQIDVRKAA